MRRRKGRSKARERTIILISQLSHHVESLVPLQGLVEENHLLLRLNALILGVSPVYSHEPQYLNVIG